MSDGVAELYDVADHFPGSHAGSFNSAIIDPPWYDAAIRSFIARTLLSLKEAEPLFARFHPGLHAQVLPASALSSFPIS